MKYRKVVYWPDCTKVSDWGTGLNVHFLTVGRSVVGAGDYIQFLVVKGSLMGQTSFHAYKISLYLVRLGFGQANGQMADSTAAWCR